MKNLRPIVTVIISVLVLGFLLWDYFNGGVPSHHILHQKDLPTISNWWNLLLMPILIWILMGRIIIRIEKQSKSASDNSTKFTNIILRFVIGLVFGIILWDYSCCFIH